MILTTKRLILRPFEASDFAAVHRYASNPDNVKYTIWGPNSESETRAFLKTVILQALAEPRTHYEFAVVLKETNALIGGCGISLDDSSCSAEIGWVLHQDFWRQGYGTELAHELLRFGFEDLQLHRIYANCNAANYGSYRVMERNGMRREAYFRQSRAGRTCDQAAWHDELQYAMLAEEWSAKKDSTLA